jgi:hypothetical protein
MKKAFVLPVAAVLFAALALALGAAVRARSVEEPAPADREEDSGARDELDEFVPSEQVPADSAVSFPVDI